MSKLEELARIIGAIYDGYVDPIDTPNRYQVAEDTARAVLTALRIPDEGMVEAGGLKIRGYDREWHDENEFFAAGFTAAIDHILGEE